MDFSLFSKNHNKTHVVSGTITGISSGTVRTMPVNNENVYYYDHLTVGDTRYGNVFVYGSLDDRLQGALDGEKVELLFYGDKSRRELVAISVGGKVDVDQRAKEKAHASWISFVLMILLATFAGLLTAFFAFMNGFILGTASLVVGGFIYRSIYKTHMPKAKMYRHLHSEYGIDAFQ